MDTTTPTPLTDPALAEQLRDARLRYVSTAEPGLTRQRKGDTFIYVDRRGQRITDKAKREWIESLGIPPAWEEVWISPYKNGHILAVGRDARGRKQYRYHPRWNALRSSAKFDQLVRFGEHLPRIRETVAAHLRSPKLTREKVLALVVRLLETTLIRVGSEEYVRHNDTYGLTTMRDEHVEFEGDEVRFLFTGKSGKQHEIGVRDRRLARLIQSSRDLPGQHLFQYVDAEGTPHAVGSGDVNAYLKEITGEDFTAKVFRTWGASTRAIKSLCCDPIGETPTAREKQVRACIKAVAAELGNTVAVCRAHYIHPAVTEALLDDALHAVYEAQTAPDTPHDLRPEEAALMALLREARDESGVTS